MRKTLYLGALSAVTVLSAASATLAADLPGLAAPLAPPAQYSVDYVSNPDLWSGFYAGGHLGGVTSDDFSEINTAWQGGIQAGYTHQFGAFVVGAELQASFNDALYYELAPGAGLTQDWAIAAKGRAGIALDSTLLYATGGVSVAELKPSGAVTSAAETHVGASFGAGVEQAIGGGFTVRAEYLQTRYFDVSSAVSGIGRTDDLTNHALTVGVNYRF